MSVGSISPLRLAGLARRGQQPREERVQSSVNERVKPSLISALVSTISSIIGAYSTVLVTQGQG